MDRLETLKNLIECNGNIDDLIQSLSKFPWDIEKPLIKVEVKDVVFILQKYNDNQLTVRQLLNWGDALEVRDDVEFDEGAKDIVYFLANPELNDQEINKEWAKNVIKKYM